MAELKENCIEWLNGQDTISVTLSQGRYINKVKKLAKKHPDLVQILAENEDIDNENQEIFDKNTGETLRALK